MCDEFLEHERWQLPSRMRPLWDGHYEVRLTTQSRQQTRNHDPIQFGQPTRIFFGVEAVGGIRNNEIKLPAAGSTKGFNRKPPDVWFDFDCIEINRAS